MEHLFDALHRPSRNDVRIWMMQLMQRSDTLRSRSQYVKLGTKVAEARRDAC